MTEIFDLTLLLFQGIINIMIDSPFIYLFALAMILTVMSVIFNLILNLGGK